MTSYNYINQLLTFGIQQRPFTAISIAINTCSYSTTLILAMLNVVQVIPKIKATNHGVYL